MTDALDALLKRAQAEITQASDIDTLESIRVKYLGRKGELTDILRGIKDLPPAERGPTGQGANQVKSAIESGLSEREQNLANARYASLAEEEWADLTKPAPTDQLGHVHPVTQMWFEIEDIFRRIGFEVADGPEVELDSYNFELLNIPKDHPARDTQASFYLTDEWLLRTQTSPVQVRYMEAHQPPIRIIAPGRVYRRDYDMTHTPMFHQFEGLVVAPGITIEDLKGTCLYAMQSLLGEQRKVRFRPHHFPFTEPSLEVDVDCAICEGKGCRTCKYTGWLEMAGAGMVHPEVLRNVQYDPEQVSGFAFGFGIDRIVMMRHGIPDTRMLFEGNWRFLAQF